MNLEYPKPREIVKQTAILGGILLASTLAFTYRARREILERDNYTCVETGKQWREGWNLNASHYPLEHKRGPDPDPSAGRTLSVESHIIEEIQRGNMWGARKLWENQTIRNYDWIAEKAGVSRDQLNAVHILLHDEKEPFEYYLEKAKERVVSV